MAPNKRGTGREIKAMKDRAEWKGGYTKMTQSRMTTRTVVAATAVAAAMMAMVTTAVVTVVNRRFDQN